MAGAGKQDIAGNVDRGTSRALKATGTGGRQRSCVWAVRQGVLFFTQRLWGGIHNTVLDLHVPAEVPLQVELAGAVGALEGPAARVEMHVA